MWHIPLPLHMPNPSLCEYSVLYLCYSNTFFTCGGGGGYLLQSTLKNQYCLTWPAYIIHILFLAGCGGVLTGLSGRLQYPHSGSIEYGHNVNCAWLIITNITKVLQLNFTKFDLEHSPNCEFDFLQVQYPPHQTFQCVALNFLWFVVFFKFVIWLWGLHCF
jgi:hypothetical protein